MHQVVIIDFGSQYTPLILKIVRSLFINVTVTSYKTFNCAEFKHAKCFILSGGPQSVACDDFFHIDRDLLEFGKPILGICYGMQLICKMLGGIVKNSEIREFGPIKINIKKHSKLTKSLTTQLTVWMSHNDSIEQLQDGFEVLATSENGKNAIVADLAKNIFCMQFHPEVTHTENGETLLKNFLIEISGCATDSTQNDIIADKIDYIKNIAGHDGDIIAAVSGGVDSTVAASLAAAAVGGRLRCIFVDTGLLRIGEADEVQKVFSDRSIDLTCVDASELFFNALANVESPEEKRKVIGKLFIDVFSEQAKKYGNAKFLLQGTLYSDVMESCAHSNTIKSHHNVGGLPENLNFTLIEPLRDLFKDDVRNLGQALGLDKDLLWRHPFPGPGLAIRVDGVVTREKVELARLADKIFTESLKEFKIYDKIWQALVFLTELRSVGVMGDVRTFERACVLRAVESCDGMTAAASRISHETLEVIANRIVNNISGISRVFFDYTSKPPATIEFQ